MTLALVFSALYARMLRDLLLQQLGEEQITTARAKGASELRVLLEHALPGELLPIATMVAMDMGRWVLTLVFVEQVFNLPDARDRGGGRPAEPRRGRALRGRRPAGADRRGR